MAALPHTRGKVAVAHVLHDNIEAVTQRLLAEACRNPGMRFTIHNYPMPGPHSWRVMTGDLALPDLRRVCAGTTATTILDLYEEDNHG